MQIKKVVVGDYQTNCYLLNIDGKVLIIDPGDQPDKIIKDIDGEVVGILVTHHHFDHTGAVEVLKEKYNVKVYDYNTLSIAENKIHNIYFEVIHNPGHTSDSISFLFNNNLFCGDFIFNQSIGRTDIGGDNEEMKKSIENILKIDKDLIIYPGHGDKTSLYKEKENLKYFQTIL